MKRNPLRSEDDEVRATKGGERGGREQRGRARIDLPPGVMDSAISGSGQWRREESDFSFSKS